MDYSTLSLSQEDLEEMVEREVSRIAAKEELLLLDKARLEHMLRMTVSSLYRDNFSLLYKSSPLFITVCHSTSLLWFYLT